MDVLGVKIDDISMDQALEKVEDFLGSYGKLSGSERSKKYYIVTPNPEMIVLAQRDADFREILNNADLAIPDGVGLGLMGVKNRVSGTDLMEQLVNLAAKQGWSVGLIGGEEGVAEKTAEVLSRRYPGVEIKSLKDLKLPKSLNIDLLFVALGHGKQERWIAENLDNIPVKVAMGVGGAFDYISGKVPRAPKFMRNLGFEWLFRLVVQPWRIKRQINLVKYLWLILLSFPRKSSGG